MKTIANPESLNLLFNQMAVSVLVIDRDDGIIGHVNPVVCKNTGKSYNEITGKHYRNVFWPEFISVYDRLVDDCRDGGEHSSIYYWGEMAVWEQIFARVIVWEGRPCVFLTITDISDVARSDYRFESIAYFDNLLKLPNGMKLEEDINDLANLETVALIYFDIDRLVELNVLYGWDNGDGILKQIRDYLLYSETCRVQLYRMNNGFAVLGRKVTLENAHQRANEIMKRFEQPWTITAAGKTISVYCSIRLCIVYGKYIQNEMRNLLLRTIHTPGAARDGYAVYDEEADKKATRKLMMRDALINCVHDDMRGFDVHYHPIVEIHSEQWVALEALCRWTAPNGEAISPLVFIHAAEQLNQISRIDNWVRRTALMECKELGLDRRDFVLDVNFSPTSKIDDAFIDNLLTTLRETKYPPDKLNLEITESAKMVFDESNLNGLRRIKDTGIILSLDDFGTGYSSFSNLIHISAKALKTEKMFLANLESDRYRRYLLKMLIELAHYHKMDFIAEGVETREQLRLLRGMGVDYVQGFLFSRPLSYEQLRGEVHRFAPM